MRANSKVAILVVSMFMLTALAPAVTVFCGSDDAVADTTTVGVYTAEAKIFTEKTTDYSSLIYRCEEFPTELNVDITDWRYDETAGYWVNINKDSASCGTVLTYSMFPAIGADQIRQDIVNLLYRDDIINLKGEKYEVSGSTITVGTTPLTYSKSGNDITIQTGSMTISAVYDKIGRELTVPISYDSFKVDYNGMVTIYNSGSPVLDSAYQVVLNDGSDNYLLMRNVDQEYAKFQLFQVTFRTNKACNVSVKITKDTADPLNININADMTYAGCYFDDLQYALLKTIDPVNGDIQPLKYRIDGDYTATIQDGYGNYKRVNAVLNGRDLYVYGSVTDINGSISGSVVTNALYGATVTYRITVDGENPYTGTSSVSSVTDETGNVEGFYVIKVPYGAKLDITDVSCDGYSFSSKTYSYGEVRGDIDPKDSVYMHIFKANERTDAVQVVDQTGAAAPNVSVLAKFYYCYGGKVTTDAPPSPATAGTLPVGKFTTDSNGYVNISYSAPTGVDYILLVWAEKSSDEASVVYTFDTNDSSTWATLPDSLDKDGNIILAASSPSATIKDEIKAKEYSFTVTLKSNNGELLEAGSIEAKWYYRGKTEMTKYNTDVLSSIISPMDPSEYAGRVKVVNNLTDSTGTLRVVYMAPFLKTLHWSTDMSSAFIYIYGKGYNFDYVDNLTSLETDPVTAGHPGCVCLSYYDGGTVGPESKFSGDDKVLISEDNIYTVSGNVTAHRGELPYVVTLLVSYSGGAPTETQFYRTGSTLSYSFKAVGGSAPTISMISEGYTFTNTSPSIGEIQSDRVINFISDYVGTTTISREKAVVIGITTGYNVDNVVEGIIIEYKYNVGGASHRTMVRATSTTVNFLVKGKSGLSVYMTASNPSEDYYVEEFDASGYANAVELVEKKNVMYKGDTSVILAGDDYEVGIYYKGLLFKTMTPGKDGTVMTKVPVTNVTYRYKGYEITPTSITDGKYTGFLGFDLKQYIPSSVERYITVTIEYYATSSIDNLSSAKCEPIVYKDETNPTTVTIMVGSQKIFTAPTLDGFEFAGWYLNGTYYSSAENAKICYFLATNEMTDDVTLHAYYSAASPKEADKGVDSTVMIIGIVAVVVAVLALVFVVFQNKRY